MEEIYKVVIDTSTKLVEVTCDKVELSKQHTGETQLIAYNCVFTNGTKSLLLNIPFNRVVMYGKHVSIVDTKVAPYA